MINMVSSSYSRAQGPSTSMIILSLTLTNNKHGVIVVLQSTVGVDPSPGDRGNARVPVTTVLNNQRELEKFIANIGI